MRLKILVTGAAGFIGSHTVDHLLAAGHTVWGLDNFRTGRRENLAEALRQPTFTLVELDVTDEPAFGGLVEQIRPEAIIHLAALVSVPESIANPALNDLLNFQATRIVADIARKHSGSRIIFASSAAVYGDPAVVPIPEHAIKRPLSPYGVAKLASENLLLEYASRHGLVAHCQRYFNVYGPRQDPSSPYSGVISIFLDRLGRNLPATIFGDGEQTRDFISVHDVARANALAATAPGLASGVANICTEKEVSLNQLWQLLRQGFSEAPVPLHVPERPGDIRRSCGSTDLAHDSFGFRSRISLEHGLRDLARQCSVE